MSQRTKRSSPRRSCHFSQGVPLIPRSDEPVWDRRSVPPDLLGATPWPIPARSRRLPPSPPCRPDACEAMQSNSVAPEQLWGKSSAPLRLECTHQSCPWRHRCRRQPDRFVSSSTPFLAWYGLAALATVRVEEDTGAVPCSVSRLCRLRAQRAQFRQRAVLIQPPVATFWQISETQGRSRSRSAASSICSSWLDGGPLAVMQTQSEMCDV